MKLLAGLRQNQLRRKRFGRYLLYALGEVVLIVIGILIAIWINNRNEADKAKQFSGVMLQEMLKDLASDTLYLSKGLERLEQHMAVEEWVLSKTSYQPQDVDSLLMWFKGGRWTFWVNERSFQKIQFASASGLTGYEELYPRVSNYYTVTQKRMQQLSELEQRATEQGSNLEQVLYQTLEVSGSFFNDYSNFTLEVDFPVSGESRPLGPFLEEMASVESRNFLRKTYARHMFVFLSFTDCKAQARRLIKEIEATLKNDV